ncbi:MAG: T9SS type A sorting domain-containing protein [Bacteroidia bacterium]
MKLKLLFLILYAAFSINSYSQYASIGTKWYYGISNLSGIEGFCSYEIISDTTVSGDIYSKVVYNNPNNSRKYSYLLLKDSTKTFYWNGTKKCLLFDTKFKKGDTLTIDANFVFANKDSSITLPVRIDSIYYISNNSLNQNDSIKVFIIRNTNYPYPNSNFGESGLYVDRFIKTGSYFDRLVLSFELPSTMDYYFYLRCFNTFGYNYKINLTKPVACDFNNTGINEMIKEKEKIEVFPNPASNELKIQTNSSEKLIALLFDITGKQITDQASGVTFTNSITINLKEISNGIYFLKITNENSGLVKMQKVVVVK